MISLTVYAEQLAYTYSHTYNVLHDSLYFSLKIRPKSILVFMGDTVPFANNILAFKGTKKAPSLGDNARNLVSECRQLLIKTLTLLADGLFENLDDALYSLADRSDTTSGQASYLDAMRQLRKYRTQIQDRFFSGLLAGFDKFWHDGPFDISILPTKVPKGSGLALLDEDELDASIAIANLISKAENRFQTDLHKLNLRLSALLGKDGLVNVNNNPLGPAGICTPFHSAFQGLIIDPRVRLIAYKVFDKLFIARIGNLYQQINHALKQAGISPELITAPHKIATAATATNGTVSKAALNSTTASNGNVTETVNLFNTLQSLLENSREIRGLAPQTQTNMPTVDRNELLGALSALQHLSTCSPDDGKAAIATGQVASAGKESDLQLRLAQRLNLQQNGTWQRMLTQVDQDTMDLVSMLFDFLLTDPHLPDALKVPIARLQIPFLKVAILDKTFFNADVHPARRLLNNLAKAAAAWSDDGDRSTDSLYGRIAVIVQRVIENFAEDPGIFAQLNADFCAYMEREQHGAEITEQRTTQITQGKEQLRLAKERVTAELTSRTSDDLHIPLVVQTLLEDGWKDVLLLTYLRQGPKSVTWKQQLSVADRLVWSVQPKTNHEQRQALLRAIPDLLYQLREGFNGISYDQHRLMRLLDELQSCHLACLRGTEYSQVVPIAFKKTTSTAVTNTDAGVKVAAQEGIDALNTEAPDEIAVLVKNLSIGSWIDISEDLGRQWRVKLSWKSDSGDAYVFVNRKGIKVMEMTFSGVMRLFRNGQAKLLGDIDIPIMSKAVNAVMANLQECAAPS